MEGLIVGVAVAGCRGGQVQKGILWARTPQKVPEPVLQPAPRKGPPAGGKPPTPCLPCAQDPVSPTLASLACSEEVSVAGLAISFPLGRAGSLEMGGLPFPEWRRHVCAESKLWN